MVYVEIKSKTANSPCKGGGVKKKNTNVVHDTKIVDVIINSTDPQVSSNENTDGSLQDSNEKGLSDPKAPNISRSGRRRKMSFKSLEAMDTLINLTPNLKSSTVTNGFSLNNNNIAVSDQNNVGGNALPQGRIPYRQIKTKTSPRTKSKSARPQPMEPKLRQQVINNMKSVLAPAKDSLSKSRSTKKSKAVSKRKTKEQALKRMEPELREELINNMKSILSIDDDSQDSISTQKSFSKSRPKQKPNKKKSKTAPLEFIDVEQNTKKLKQETDGNGAKGKPKQVTLSNGVVLTLSLVKCDYCQKTFSNKQSLSRHMLMHLNLKPHSCRLCPKKFRYNSTLKIHIRKNHPDTLKEGKVAPPVVPEFYVCQICDKEFMMQDNLELHLQTHIKSENNFNCLYCEKKFSYRLLLLQHEKTHLTTNKYKCHMCEMSYDCRNKLTLHIKSHKKIKDYICQYCGKEFGRLSGIKRHVRVSHGGQRVECPICRKKLKGHLTEHMRVHEHERPHVCDECGQRFTQSTQLTVHKRSHTGDKPYVCKICKRPFGHSNALMLHIRRHTGEKPFSCAMCPMTFSQLPHMKTHMSRIHGKESSYKCDKCREFFKLKFDLDQHIKTCTVGEKELTFEEKIQATVQFDEIEVESTLSLSKMRFLIALLLSMIASKDKMKVLGFNKRLIDELLEESLSAMGHNPCKEDTLTPLKRLKANVEILLKATVPEMQMEKFRGENKTTEQILLLLTEEIN